MNYGSGKRVRWSLFIEQRVYIDMNHFVVDNNYGVMEFWRNIVGGRSVAGY